MAMGRAILVLFTNLSEVMVSRIGTILGTELGISMPMEPLPGIGAMIRMPMAATLSAMSSSRFFILLILTPTAGTISYIVTVGPSMALMDWISTPKLESIVFILTLLFWISSSRSSLLRAVLV